jgi:hypothetical protein
MDELSEHLEVVPLVPRGLPELLEDVEGIEEVVPVEATLLFEFLQCVVDGLLLICDDSIGFAAHDGDELAEKVLVDLDGLVVGDD